MGRGRRWLHRIAWLFKSLFLNLTPARRVLLALALLLLCVRAQWRGDGPRQVQPLPTGGPALGIPVAATYEEQSVDLGADQTLVVYSDGVTEALNEGDVFFGDERLLGSLRETAGRPAAEVAHQLLETLEVFVGEARWHDDVSLMVVRRAG